MSEKFDGVRGIYYDGKFISRTNRSINVPVWFVDIFKTIPSHIAIDGEFFTERSDFNTITSIVCSKNSRDKDWKKIKFVCFDIVNMIEVFEDRMELLSELITPLNSKHAECCTFKRVESKDNLDKFHDEIVSNGGEGVMLREPESFYENKRSMCLLKYKKFKDEEAVVEDVMFGDGKNIGRMGALKVRWLTMQNTDAFSVGTGFTDEQRIKHAEIFPKGTIIKVKYFELTEFGVPRFPSFIAIIPAN
jgi:DNA ligase-1